MYSYDELIEIYQRIPRKEGNWSFKFLIFISAMLDFLYISLQYLN